MKKLNFALLLAAFISVGGGKSYAHDIEVANADGVTIYYNFINDKTELEVTYQGSDYFNADYAGKVVIPESVTYESNTYSVTFIGERAFIRCSGLTEVTIPNSVTSIGDGAFSGCTGLTEVTIGNGVTSIGSSAFASCSGLTELTIPSSVTSIGNNAFYNCSSLIELTIPSSVTHIVYTAFEGCSGLEKITVESGNLYYDSRENCNAIIKTYSNELMFGCKNTIIPGNVTDIGAGAFASCSGLTELTIPSSVTYISMGAFWGCSSLTTLYSLNTTPPVVTTSIFNDSHYTTVDLLVPAEALEAYQTADVWKDFQKLQAIGNTTAVTEVTAAEQIQTANGQIVVTGLTDGTTVAVYDLGGQQVGQTVSKGGQAAVNTGLTSGAVVVKVGERSVKVTMK